MEKVWQDEAWEAYLYWQTQDKKTLKKLNRLIQAIDRHGYQCQGQPEPFKGPLSGFLSVHIDEKHRLLLRLVYTRLQTAQCVSHYRD